MFFELKQYRLKKGMGDQFADLMEEIILPFQKKTGMNITGSFRVRDDSDLFVWIRRFENESQKKLLYDKVYGSNYWKETVRPAMGDIIIKEESITFILEPTESSDLR